MAIVARCNSDHEMGETDWWRPGDSTCSCGLSRVAGEGTIERKQPAQGERSGRHCQNGASSIRASTGRCEDPMHQQAGRQEGLQESNNSVGPLERTGF